MLHRVELLLFLMGIIGLFAVIATRFRIPFPILLVFVGAGIAAVPQLPRLTLDPELVFVLILPPLLYVEALRFPWREFVTNVRSILLLAIGLVMATTLAVAFTMHALVPGLTLAGAFILGAIVSPPDAIAATEVLKRMRIPERVMSILKGESLINDASALVIYQMALVVWLTGFFSWEQSASRFLLTSLGGIAIGLLVGFLVTKVVNFISDPVVEVTVSLMTPFLAYLPAYELELSGVLSTVAAGLFIGHRLDRILAPESRIVRRAVWQFVTYFFNGLVFVLIGSQFPEMMRDLQHINLWQLICWAIVLAAIAVAVRLAWMFSVGYGMGREFLPKILREPSLSNRELALMSWCGMRGVVSLAAALAIPLVASPDKTLERSLILFFTISLIISSLVFQGLTLPALIRFLRIKGTKDAHKRETKARLTLANEALATIPEFAVQFEVENTDIPQLLRDYYASFSAHLQHGEHKTNSKQDQQASLLFISKVICHQRYCLRVMQEKGEITEDIYSRLEYDLDLSEERLRRLIPMEDQTS